MLHLHDQPLKLWAEAVHTAVYLLNRTINRQVGYTTPFELWFKTKPIVSHYRTFGTLAYIFIDKSLRTKFQNKGTQVIFVGYSATSKGWRFWNPITDRISESSDVIFDEATGYSPSLFPSQQSLSVSIPTHLPVSTILPPHLQFFHCINCLFLLSSPLLIQWEFLLLPILSLLLITIFQTLQIIFQPHLPPQPLRLSLPSLIPQIFPPLPLPLLCLPSRNQSIRNTVLFTMFTLPQTPLSQYLPVLSHHMQI